MGRVIRAAEVRSNDTVGIARWLLGKALVRTRGRTRRVLLITEVEAYDSERDLACHACKGRTPRTDTLYRAGGVWYVYFVYGMHHMLNLVTGPEGHPAAVLIRGLISISGPGRITKALAIGRKFNGIGALPRAGLHLEDLGLRVPRSIIRATPRIGVEYAGPLWAGKLWRFCLDPGAAEGLWRRHRESPRRPSGEGARAGKKCAEFVKLRAAGLPKMR
jgi:DNA-3-methyladenine glycosylase